MIIRGNQLETLETVLLFHDYVFFNVDLNEVYSEIDEDNLPAQGVAKSAGAVNRGYVDDREKKLLMYVAMKDDYIKAREKLAKLVERFAARLGE